MISDIQIEFFGTHKNTHLSFINGVNAIVGTSGHGKSRIIKAIRWALKNDPLGFEFHSLFAGHGDETVVGIEFNDGQYIVRERGSKLNRYMTQEHGEDDPLEAFYSDPPQEIHDIANISDFSLQGQFDRYFLLDKDTSSGEVAKILNKEVGLEISDLLVSNLNGKIKKANHDINNAEEDIESLTKELESIKYIDDIEKEISKLEKLLKQRDLIRSEKKVLIQLVREIEAIDKEIEQYNICLEIEKETYDLLKLVGEYNEVERELKAIKELVDGIDEIDNEIEDINYDLEYLPIAKELAEEIKDYKKIDRDIAEMKTLINEIESIDLLMLELDKEIKQVNLEIKEIGVCPYCRRPL